MSSTDLAEFESKEQLAVLIVDDDMAMRNSVRRVLMLDAYRVEMAGSGKELLAIQDLAQFFAILLDRRLPDMDASEVVGELRQRAPSVAILIITGYADMNHAITAIRQGIDDYLVKPVEPETLRSRLIALAELFRVKRQIKLTQQKLVQSERLAAIGQMVTGLAHESRNALQRARSCLDLLELDLQGKTEQLDMTQRIREALGDLQRNYEEVRNYAAPIVLQLQQVDCIQILQRAFQDLKEEFPRSEHRLSIPNATTPISLQADEFRLLQVFRNILENAMAATPNDSPIEVRFQNRIVEGRSFEVIAFHDSGEGMDESTLSQIFEPFYTTKQSGTGLGMAICKRIVESHGGRIIANGEKGKGSTITVMLPRCSNAARLVS